MTVIEGIQKSTEFLAKKGVEPPRLHAELLLSYVLRMPRMKLYLDFERALSPTEVNNLRELVRRRGLREPLQHIVGSASFCGLEIAVNRNALIPRPETELLAEEGWTFLNSQHAASSGPTNALDLGTGTGCIAIAIAAKCPEVKIVAIEISPEALALAKQNAERHDIGARIEFLEGDGFTGTQTPSRFDLIISNPPYVPTAEIESLEPEVRDHDPRAALDGGVDGLDHIRRIAIDAHSLLKPDGRLMIEFGDGQSESVRNIFERQNWIVEAIKQDYNQRPRFLIAKI